MSPILASFVLFFVVASLVILWRVKDRFTKKEKAYKLALESNQKRLDLLTSQFNILMRALPNLQALLDVPSPDSWKSICLDEVRALIRADGASYWRILEENREVELEVARGTEVYPIGGGPRFSLEHGELGEAAKQQAPVLLHGSGDGQKGGSSLIVPLTVAGSVWGVFRLVRQGPDPLTQKDSDLVDLFTKQLSMVLENRELVGNRERFYLELVQTIADLLDSRDSSSEGQSRRARRLARGIAKELNLPGEFVYYLEFAALMHDMGNMAIDDHLLKKPGKLTTQEFEIIKKHPELGYKILSKVSMLAPVAPMVLYHQEWFNGRGYPEGLSGEEIPLGARIVSILDAWGAMTSDRPWRKALTVQQAIREIQKGAGTQFDPKVVEAFISIVERGG